MELYLKAQSTSRELSCELFCGVVNLFTVDSIFRHCGRLFFRHCSELSCGVYIVNLFGIVTGSPVCCGDMMNCGGVVNK